MDVKQNICFAVIFKTFTYDCKILCSCRFKVLDELILALYKTSLHHMKSFKPTDLCSRSGKKSK